MTNHPISILLALSLLSAGPLGADSAKTPGRMSVSVSASGRRLTMRYGGHRKTYRMVRGISIPVLSPNGRQAVYIMARPYYPIPVNVDDGTPNSLWLLDAATGKNTKIAQSSEGENKQDISGISSPVFSLDGTQLYFLSSGIGADETVHAVDLATRRVRFVCEGGSLRIIHSGPYQSDLIVYAQTSSPDGTIDAGRNWLVSPEGRRIKPWGLATDGPETQ